MRAAVVNWPFKVIQGGAHSPVADTANVAGRVRGKAPAVPATSVKARAVSLLAQREYSRQALRDKLISEDASPEEIEQALAQLEAKGLVDDERVVETLVNRRAGKLGASRLRQELQAKGVSAELVAETMADLKGTELARARAVWQKKFGLIATSATDRNKQARFLTSRGFSGEVVRQVVAGIADD
jgi:regulatory protein